MSKHQRQHRVARLLAGHVVTRQEQLVGLLADEGIESTQATVSRDLDDLGAVKVRVPGAESMYAIPEHPADRVVPIDQLRRVMGEWVVDVGYSGNLVVLRTPPGSAHVVASALDRTGIEGSIGTVAGDDTLMVVAAEGTTGEQLATALRALAGL